jgi:dolichol kinase
MNDSTAQHSTAQHSTAQHSTAQHSTKLASRPHFMAGLFLIALLSLFSGINLAMISIRSLLSKSFLASLIVGAWGQLPLLVGAQSCTAGTIQNTSSSSTTTSA